ERGASPRTRRSWSSGSTRCSAATGPTSRSTSRTCPRCATGAGRRLRSGHEGARLARPGPRPGGSPAGASPRCDTRRGTRRRSPRTHELEEHRHRAMVLHRVPERPVPAHAVAIPATDALAMQILVGFELLEDPLHGPLGDADPGGDIADARFGVLPDAEE